MNSSLIIVLGVVILGLLIKFATKIIAKILGLVALVIVVVGFMYSKGIGPFKETSADLKALTAKYCSDPEEAAICDCIIKNAEVDMRKRFTEAEMDTMSRERIRAAYVLKRSLDATKAEAMECLTKRGMENKYKQFTNDFIPIENEYLEAIGNKTKEWGEKLKQEAESFLLNKNDIDSRY
jgi:hypothetical protein